MENDEPAFVEATRSAFAEELTDAQSKIQHCAAQLSETQIWWRPDARMNSIANLVLHLCGNLRQWIVAGVGGAEDVRNRPAEFAARDSASADDLLRLLENAVAEAREVIGNVPVDELVGTRRIQGFKVSGVQAILHSVTHFRGHTQEIVHLTRTQLGDAYQFDFVPATPEGS
jgi:hypothetical protein